MLLFFLRQIGLMMIIGLMCYIIPSLYASEASIIQNVIKIKAYTISDNGAFVFTSYGSAIAISESRILTNAHVILDTNGEPTGQYEICMSRNFESVPRCTDVARLIAYDVVADLAILELSHTTTLTPFALSHNKIAIGSYVSMYGYPGIGGETITRTEGKIAGYEQGMYKIDGSIDHGNSGGGAFNSSGELLGIPTAVASDNASIGYMIPIKRIEEFLMKKTPSYEINNKKLDRDFVHFIQKNQSYNPDSPGYRFQGIQIKNPRPYGFKLNSTMVSRDGKMIYWTFADTYDRVKFNFVCTDDAGKILGWQARLSGLTEEQKLYPSWDIRATDDINFLTVYSSSKGFDPGIVLYYKNYDACYIDLNYLDSKKDANSLKRAIKFVKQAIQFNDPYSLKSEQENTFFGIKNTEKNTRIVRSIDKLGNESISLGFEVEPGRWLNGVIEGKKYTSISEFGADQGIDFSEIKTWNDYVALGIKNGIVSSRIEVIDLGIGKKGVLYSSFNPDKNTTTVNFEYMYQLSDSSYAYWNWSATMSGDYSPDPAKFGGLLRYLSFPGRSFFF